MINPCPQIPRIPHLVHIETTYRCNQECLFCYNPNRNKKIDFHVLDEIVKRVRESLIPHVYLIGGEPTLIGAERLNAYIDLLAEQSSVTIVTNGQIYIDDLSSQLACIGVPVHGNEQTHNHLTNRRDSYQKAMRSITNYVKRGFDVRCIPVLTAQNYDQMYDLIGLAKRLGMDSVFVDRFEDGGLGSKKASYLKPSISQFRIALGQMIQGRDDFGIPVGWGTAVPFCLDARMLETNMTCNCGAGITFAAINPSGDVRICNQSERIYGNILQDTIEVIWHKPELAEFRDFGWISEACRKCALLPDCAGGCKVDTNHTNLYCVDYSVRGHEKPYQIAPTKTEHSVNVPSGYRSFVPNRYARLISAGKETRLVTRYQTVEMDEMGSKMFGQVLGGIHSERDLINMNMSVVEYQEVRRFVSLLEIVGAIDVTGVET